MLIKQLKKCTYDCNKEEIYKYQYGGNCLEECPSDTSPNEKNICKDNNIDSCSKSKIEIDLQEFLMSGGVDATAKNYAKEFDYTNKHVSQYYNSIYSILLYKDVGCFEELNLDMAKADFGDCYTKVQNNLDPPSNQSLVVALIERENGAKKSNSFFFYHPVTGEKLDVDTICKDEEVVIKESVISQLNNSEVDLNSILYLAQQDINIFSLSDAFYNDLCYHFESPNGKDVPLSDRVKAYYPNITLCNPECTSKGVNLTSMESICECKFSDLYNNEVIEGNAFLKNTIGEITDILSSSNLLVLKCYQNDFKKENILKGSGGFIILSIILFQIIFAFIFFLSDMPLIRKFVYNLTESFLQYISKDKKEIEIAGKKTTVSSKKNILKSPPKKNKNKTKTQKFEVNSYRKESTRKNLNVDEGNTFKSDYILMNQRKNKLAKNKNDSYRKLKKGKSIKMFKNKNIKFNCENIDIEEYLKPDLDEMDYEDALKYDKRKFCEYFGEKLKEKQIIMNTFYNKEDLRPMSIKIILFLLNIDLYFVINGLFFNEEYISQLFNSDKEETFFSFLPRSINRFIYTFMVGIIVGIIIDCMFIEESRIKRTLEREKSNPLTLKCEISLIIKSIKKRYTLFILLCLFISIISWYYISCFNNTYPGVRMEWIKSSIAIIIIMQILSILSTLLQAILRTLSFDYKSEKLFKFKQFF